MNIDQIELEKCYHILEVETREAINLYHLLIALVQCDVSLIALLIVV